MASGGQTSNSPTLNSPPKSWAQIASVASHYNDNSPLHNAQVLSKLKESTMEFVKIDDDDALSRARLHFQHFLYGKFYGKTPSFNQVQTFLVTKWAEIGEVMISNLPSGFFLIRCAFHDVIQRLLLEGPWSINGIILQLSTWCPFFEPVFAKLNTAIIWVQLHNLPVKFWDGNTFESISGHLCNLLKIDDLTVSLSRSKYARVCIEIYLSKPLSKGFWIGNDQCRVFIIVLYERLPTFCYSCDVVGNGSNASTVKPTTGMPLPLHLLVHHEGMRSVMGDHRMLLI